MDLFKKVSDNCLDNNLSMEGVTWFSITYLYAVVAFESNNNLKNAYDKELANGILPPVSSLASLRPE